MSSDKSCYKLQKEQVRNIRELLNFIDNRLDDLYKDGGNEAGGDNGSGHRHSSQQEIDNCEVTCVCMEMPDDRRKSMPPPMQQAPMVNPPKWRHKIHHYQTLDGKLVCSRSTPDNIETKNPGDACQKRHANVAACVCCHNME